MSVDPKNLATTAVQTFGDDFNSLSLYNGTAGTWETTYPWVDRLGNGSSLNDEQEWYINSRFPATASVKPWSVANSILTITAMPTPDAIKPFIGTFQKTAVQKAPYEYVSGVMTTYKSFSQLYGYFECSAQLPKGQGTWPAFWMGQATVSDWPATGATWPPEVDILEVLGKNMTELYQTVHTSPANTAIGQKITTPDMSVAFHTYGVGWWQDFVIFYFDRVETFRLPTPSDMKSRPMFLMLDLALGGSWGGPVDATTPFPAKMLVDYVRAYKSADGSVLAPVAGQTQPPPPPPPTATTLTGTVTGPAGDIWDVRVTKR